jgi:hypothetical protein
MKQLMYPFYLLNYHFYLIRNSGSFLVEIGTFPDNDNRYLCKKYDIKGVEVGKIRRRDYI